MPKTTVERDINQALSDALSDTTASERSKIMVNGITIDIEKITDE